MITSNITSNTIFFTKSEQWASIRYTLYPFYTFYPVFYTSLYLFIPYRKTHNISPQSISATAPYKIHSPNPIF